MEKSKVRRQLIIYALLFYALLFCWQCSKKYPADFKESGMAVNNGCVACHTDADLLKKVATPLPPVDGDAGEG